MKKCNSCGFLQPSDNNYCTQCGSKVFDHVEEDAVAKKRSRVKQGGIKGKQIVFIAAFLTIAAFGVIAAMKSFDPVKRVMASVESDSFTNAAEVYQQHIDGNEKREQKTAEKITAYVEDKLAQYERQEITYEEVMEKLNGAMQLRVANNRAAGAITKVEYLNYCRQNYQLAEEAFNNERYEEAIRHYGIVVDKDFENAENAVDKRQQSMELYQTQVLKEVTVYLDNYDFATASALIKTALNVLPNNPYFLEALENCEKGEHAFKIHCFVEEARVYMKNNDYVGALKCLDEYIEANPEEVSLVEEKQACLLQFEQYVREESLRLAKEGKYQNALSLAESGLNYFTSPKVIEVAEVYRSHIPVILGKMELFQNKTDGGSFSSKTFNTNKYLEDNYGNVYENSVSVGCGSVTYLVNFKYQKFTGTVAFPKGLESDGPRKSATLIIYGDGNKIASFSKIDDSSKPEQFSLDISSYEKITLKWLCEGYNIWQDWGYFATIFDGIFEPIPMALPE